MLRGNRHSRQRPQGLGIPMFERLEPRLLLNAVPYMQDFSLGKPGGVEGQNWVKVTDLTVNFTNRSFDLDPVLLHAQVAAGSSDLSNVRIKFQQYDNYYASTDGREFDNIKVS